MEHLIYWIWFSLRCGVGSEFGSYLLSHFETPKAVFDAKEEDLFKIEGMDRNSAEPFLDHDLTFAGKILKYCERMNVGIMTPESAVYPERLKQIHAKPLVLYYRGRIPNLDDHVLISCVGTRKCSKQGKETAYRLGYGLAEAGAIVVSGMALGIDAAAQMGALDAGGHTIAVLGCGIDRCYPLENAELMERIAKKGTILTEFAPGTDPNGKNFPIRNRIISGLSQGTVVVEADDRSGALITARSAVKQGRDVFAFPGDASNPLYTGTNMLIQDGAKLVTSAFDVLIEYEPLYPHRILTERLVMVGRRAREDEAFSHMNAAAPPARYHRKKQEKPSPKSERKQETREIAASVQEKKVLDLTGCSELEKQILSAMKGMMSPEELSSAIYQETGIQIPVGELLAQLTLLEIGGYVEAVPGGSFRLV